MNMRISKIRILHFAVISQAISTCQSSIADEDVALDHLFKNIESNVDPYKLNVITECSRSLSPLSNKIVQRANKDFVSSNIDRGNSALIINENMSSEQLKYHGLQRVSERMSLTMGIVESENGSNLVHNMSSMLGIFDAINPLTRATVHSFNPFSDTFQSEILGQHTALFPSKVTNLHGFLLGLVLERQSFEHDIDMFLVKMICEEFNCGTRDIAEEDFTAEPSHNSYHSGDLFLPFDCLSFTPRKEHAELVDFLEQHLTEIYVPMPDAFHFYLMRPKEYRKTISVASILTFAGLSFTAGIFAVWARLLGFRVENWTFLNILTAQMGGSLEHHGRMKMSEKIFLMSIYISTFIIVTLGTDYMLEIFVYRGELIKIETIEDLANSNLNLTMEFFDHKYMGENLSEFMQYDKNLKKIYDRIKPRMKSAKLSTFCRNTYPPHPLDESFNLCIMRLSMEHEIMTSDDIVHIDKIKDPIIVFLLAMRFTKIQFFKERWEELIHRFLELGMFERLKGIYGFYHRSSPTNTRTDEDISNKTVPPEEQLQPIFLVGCTVSILALICEMIWHRFMERTELGKLFRAFHHRLHSTSSSSRIETDYITPPASDLMMINRRLRKFSSQPNPMSDCQRYAQIEDTCFGELLIVDIDHHYDCMRV
ncbi:hypothetical protein QAD02_017770 [Eretmocerus hayati]|uniref:Uncharacterized protein n=1 Tax=Eretmocerus hayati TaxID=131215 RepID=A0ACC2PFX4_9HYME|nr:hypothetical protein QAD02_017770 [Eretmocerus hayati]